MKTALIVVAILGALAVANAQSCKTYARGAHFACNLAAGECCQKGLDCVSGKCEVPGTPAPAPTPAPSCKTYSRGTHFACNLAAGECCQKGLDCVSGKCEVPKTQPKGKKMML